MARQRNQRGDAAEESLLSEPGCKATETLHALWRAPPCLVGPLVWLRTSGPTLPLPVGTDVWACRVLPLGTASCHTSGRHSFLVPWAKTNADDLVSFLFCPHSHTPTAKMSSCKVCISSRHIEIENGRNLELQIYGHF